MSNELPNESVPGFDAFGRIISGSIFRWVDKTNRYFCGIYSTGTEIRVELVEGTTDRIKLWFVDTLLDLKMYSVSSFKNQTLWEFVRYGNPLLKKPLPAAAYAQKLQEEAPRNPFEKAPVKYTKIYRDPMGSPLHLEKLGRELEMKGHYGEAKTLFYLANQGWPPTRQFDAEEKALDEGNVVKVEDLKNMSSTDRKAWELKGLKPFVFYKQFTTELFWYEVKQ